MAAVDVVVPSERSRPPRVVTDRNGLEVLDQATCLGLLARSPIGRVAYIAAGTARVVPVNIAMRDGELFFRVGTGGLLAAIAERQLLTVEADEVDVDGSRGWSVMVTGSAHEIVRRPDRSLPTMNSWLRSDAARLVHLTALEISGRRVLPAADAPAATRRVPARRPETFERHE